MRGHIPFDRDIERNGSYLYSGESAPLSAVYANTAQSRLIHQAISTSHKNILDVGCGDGKYTFELLQIASIESVMGMDTSEQAIKVASKKYNHDSRIRFSTESLAELHRLNYSFDLAIVRGVLHHAENPENLLVELSRLTRDIIVLEPNGLNIALKVIEKTSSYHIEHGERSFPFWQIESWLHHAGFKVDKKRVGVLVPFFCPRSLAIALHIIQPFAEKVFFLRWFICGTQVFFARKN